MSYQHTRKHLRVLSTCYQFKETCLEILPAVWSDKDISRKQIMKTVNGPAAARSWERVEHYEAQRTFRRRNLLHLSKPVECRVLSESWCQLWTLGENEVWLYGYQLQPSSGESASDEECYVPIKAGTAWTVCVPGQSSFAQEIFDKQLVHGILRYTNSPLSWHACVTVLCLMLFGSNHSPVRQVPSLPSSSSYRKRSDLRRLSNSAQGHCQIGQSLRDWSLHHDVVSGHKKILHCNL